MNSKEIFDILLKEAGMKSADLAEKSGVTGSTVYAITGGRTQFEKIGVNTFMKLAGALGMDAEELYEVGQRIEDGTYYEYATVDLSPEERRRTKLLSDYDSMPDEGKRTLETVADALARTYEMP